MKIRPDASRTVENESGSAKHEKQVSTPSVPPKTSLRVQNMKKGPDAHNTAENEFGSAKYENYTRRRRKPENESESTKHESET
jgi:hypothetical protein